MARRKFDGQGPGSSTGVLLHPDRLDKPLHWRKPRRVFVNSLSDLFHDDVPADFIARVFAVMASSAAHTFQVLTKRPGRMCSLLSRDSFRQDVAEHWRPMLSTGPCRAQNDALGDWWPLRNVWLGTSVESQDWARVRIPQLVKTPAAVHFLSCEPLLDLLDLSPWLPSLDWVIAGGESGPGAREMRPEWVRAIRDDCLAADVAFHFKQWGGIRPKAGGRELDGRTHDAFPAAVPA